jgi:hypothetical protein
LYLAHVKLSASQHRVLLANTRESESGELLLRTLGAVFGTTLLAIGNA